MFVLLMGTSAMAAAPEMLNYSEVIDTATVDSAYHDGFEEMASIVTITTDSAHTIFTATGTVELSPGDAFYVAMGDDSANVQSATNLKADTSMGVGYVELPLWAKGKTRITFNFAWVDSVETQTDVTDTFFLNCAVRSSGKIQFVDDFIFTAEIGDQN